MFLILYGTNDIFDHVYMGSDVFETIGDKWYISSSTGVQNKFYPNFYLKFK